MHSRTAYNFATTLLLTLTVWTLSSVSTVSAQQSSTAQTECKTSPRVVSELAVMDKELQRLDGKVTSQCTPGLQRQLRQVYLEVLGVGTDFESVISSVTGLVDIDENQALPHDLALYQKKLDKFDTLAKKAYALCSPQDEILAAKKLYYDGQETDPEAKGYRALQKALTNDVAGKPNYFYQSSVQYPNGYYSDFKCSSKTSGVDFKWDDISKAWENFQSTLKTLKRGQDQISLSVSDQRAKELYQQFLANQGLITIEQANELMSGKKDQGNSFSAFFQNLGEMVGRSVSIAVEQRRKNYAQIQEDFKKSGVKSVSQEALQNAKTSNESLYQQLLDAESLKGSYKVLYNQVTVGRYESLDSALKETDLFIQKDLCPKTKEAANNLVAFCKNVVANKGGECDDMAAAQSACK